MSESNGNASITPAQAAGNDEVIKILAKYLALAKAGNFVSVGIVAVSGPGQVGTEYGGAAGMEFAMNFGIDYLKDQVIQGFVERMHTNARGIQPVRAPLIVG